MPFIFYHTNSSPINKEKIMRNEMGKCKDVYLFKYFIYIGNFFVTSRIRKNIDLKFIRIGKDQEKAISTEISFSLN